MPTNKSLKKTTMDSLSSFNSKVKTGNRYSTYSLLFKSIIESILYFSPVSCVRISHKTSRMGTEEGSATQTVRSFFDVFRKLNAPNWYSQNTHPWGTARVHRNAAPTIPSRTIRAENCRPITAAPANKSFKNFWGLSYLSTWFSSVYITVLN